MFVYLATQVQVRILEVNSPKGLRLTGRGGPWHRTMGDGDGDGMMQELLGDRKMVEKEAKVEGTKRILLLHGYLIQILCLGT